MYKISYDFQLNRYFPQIQEFDMTDKSEKYPNFDFDGLLSPNLRLPRYIMHKKATVTDLISSAPLSNCLILSQSVISILKEFNLATHQYFEVQFIHNKKLYTNFYALYFAKNSEYLNLIDWDKSSFFKTKDWHETILEEYKFQSWDEMREFEKKYFWGQSEFGFLYKIKIRENVPFDLINFQYFGFPPGFICSEKLKNKIIDSNFTGFSFEGLVNDWFV